MKTYVVGQVPSGYAPLPPENVLVNGARYPADISGQYTISWAPNPRKRVYSAAVSGDETYTLRLYDETDTLRRTVTDITGNSYTWTTEVADSGLSLAEYSQDTFTTDTSASYTEYHDPTAATWTISGGELVVVGGGSSLLIRTGTSYANATVEVDTNYVDDGGLILRFIDNNNHYILILSDDTAAPSTNNMIIYKRVSGTYTQLSQANVTFPRGTSSVIRFQANGTTITGFLNGVSVITATDSSISSAGGIGVRNSGSGKTSKYQALRWDFKPRRNSSIRAELEAVRGGVTSYQKRIIKSTRSVTTV